MINRTLCGAYVYVHVHVRVRVRVLTHVCASQPAHLLVAVEGVQVLQRRGHQARGHVPVDEGQGLPRLQVAVGPRLVVLVSSGAVGPAALRPRPAGQLLGDVPLDGGQRLGYEGAEAVGSRRYKQLGHLDILLLGFGAAGGGEGGGCRGRECWG